MSKHKNLSFKKAITSFKYKGYFSGRLVLKINFNYPLKKLGRVAVGLLLEYQKFLVIQYNHRVYLQSLPFTLNSAIYDLCKTYPDY